MVARPPRGCFTRRRPTTKTQTTSRNAARAMGRCRCKGDLSSFPNSIKLFSLFSLNEVMPTFRPSQKCRWLILPKLIGEEGVLCLSYCYWLNSFFIFHMILLFAHFCSTKTKNIIIIQFLIFPTLLNRAFFPLANVISTFPPSRSAVGYLCIRSLGRKVFCAFPFAIR